MPTCPVRSEPWLVEGAIAFLNYFIEPHHRVLEFGGGASTLWFAKRCSVVTYDSDPNYIAIVKSLLNVNIDRVELHRAAPAYEPHADVPQLIDIPAIYPPESFDLVLVDTGLAAERQGCLRNSIRLIRPGGVLMADNADGGWVQPYIPELQALMPDWNYTYAVQCRPDKFGFISNPGWATCWWHRSGVRVAGEMYEGAY